MGDECCAPSRGQETTVDQAVERTASDDTSGMVRVEGGDVLVGTNDAVGNPGDAEGPVRSVTLAPYWISTTAVTNAEFGAFVANTSYRTDAERYGWSFVFHLFVSPMVQAAAQRVAGVEWWVQVYGATWSAPTGPSSHAEDDHPVVHVSWRDAHTYAIWAGKRLPSEIEWEHAAAGGLDTPRYPWGDEFLTGANAKANIFEGDFPRRNTAEDGYAGTAPVTAYDANGYGLHNMVGNVWEWTSDWWGTNRRAPESGQAKVMKGGSYLCHDSYCNRYRIAARTSNTPDSSTGNTGFRVAQGA